MIGLLIIKLNREYREIILISQGDLRVLHLSQRNPINLVIQVFR